MSGQIEESIREFVEECIGNYDFSDIISDFMKDNIDVDSISGLENEIEKQVEDLTSELNNDVNKFADNIEDFDNRLLIIENNESDNKLYTTQLVDEFFKNKDFQEKLESLINSKIKLAFSGIIDNLFRKDNVYQG